MKYYLAQVKGLFHAVDIYAKSKKEARQQLKDDYGFTVKAIWESR